MALVVVDRFYPKDEGEGEYSYHDIAQCFDFAVYLEYPLKGKKQFRRIIIVQLRQNR